MITTDTELQLTELRTQLAAERASRQDWAAEAMRLDIEVERLTTELAQARTAHHTGQASAADRTKEN